MEEGQEERKRGGKKPGGGRRSLIPEGDLAQVTKFSS